MSAAPPPPAGMHMDRPGEPPPALHTSSHAALDDASRELSSMIDSVPSPIASILSTPQPTSATRGLAAAAAGSSSSHSSSSRQQPTTMMAAPVPLAASSSSRTVWASMYDQQLDDHSDGEEGDFQDASDADDERAHVPAPPAPRSSSKRADRAVRKSINATMRDLSPTALNQVEALVRSLAAAKKSAPMPPVAPAQVEGTVGWQYDQEDDDDIESDHSDNHRVAASYAPVPPVASVPVPPVKSVSPPASLPSLGMQRNWNDEFQQCFTEICNDSTILDNVAGYSALSSLAHDFLWTATTLGRMIISERQLPPHQKTIPPINLGGYAGGLKYVCANIIFKFAVDNSDQLYGGDQFAAKAAGHELLGLSHYYRTIASSEGRLGLHVPLAALIDFRGYRLYATCKLPIDGAQTLVLGSMDGGNTIINSNAELDAKMRIVAKVLNLKVHLVTDRAGTKTELPACFDIEGHRGQDGRYYLVDFHRTFPPEPPAVVLETYVMEQARLSSSSSSLPSTVSSPPSPSSAAPSSPPDSLPPLPNLATLHAHHSSTRLKNSYLYRMLRPELVRSYTASPLSSNVYTSFDRDADNHQHVMLAYRGLIEEVIPTFARALERNPPPQRFVDSGSQMQQQTANMIRTSTDGASDGSSAAIGNPASTPRMSRSPSISSLVSPATNSSAPTSSSDRPPPTLSLDILSSVLHQSGINVRYLGLVRSQMQCPSWRQVLLVEMIARLLKNELRARWRRIRASMSDGPFRATAVNFINLIFFPSLASNTYWTEHLQREMNLHFPAALSGDEADPSKFHLKASFISTTDAPRQMRQTSPTSAEKAPACPVHHASHTHFGVDPADLLSFLPPMRTPATEKANGTPRRATATFSSAVPPMPMSARNSSSSGHTRHSSHLPSTATAAHGASASDATPSYALRRQSVAPPRGHHAHSVSTPSAPSSATSGARDHARRRVPNILDPPPEIPCPGDGCCGQPVDYLLLLFLRFIQLTGIVLEEGIVEAIQAAADKQAAVAHADSPQPDPIQRPPFEETVVGEGSLRIDRVPQRDRQPIPAPIPHHRSVTEPRGGASFLPTSPPAFHHAHTTAAFPPLSHSRHVNSPASVPASTPTMVRHLSASNLAHVPPIITPPPPLTQWRLPSSIPSTPHTPHTPTSASGRNTPCGSDVNEDLSRSRSGSFAAPILSGGLSGEGNRLGLIAGENWNLWSWPFVAPLEEMHIRGLVEKAKQVNLTYYAEGTSLLIKAWEKLQQHKRLLEDHSGPSTTKTATTSGTVTATPVRSKKFFYLPGHLQADEVFRNGPTPHLKMAFHLAGLAANKFQQALKYCITEEHEVLTNRGFLSLEEVIKCAPELQQGRPSSSLRFASYDPATRMLVYHHATSLTVKTVDRLVEFTHDDEAARWRTDADKYGRTNADDDASVGDSNGVSIIVDPSHDMYVATGEADPISDRIRWSTGSETKDDHLVRATNAMSKVKAASLATQGEMDRIMFLAAPTGGLQTKQVRLPFIDALHLQTPAEVAAFIQIYGCWLSCGSLHHRSKAVEFRPHHESTREWIQSHLRTLGVVGRDELVIARDAGEITMSVKRQSWVVYFSREYGRTESPLHPPVVCAATPGVEPAKRFCSWSWQLKKGLVRCLLRGLAHDESGAAKKPCMMHTRSAQFRDHLIALCLHAGFAATFKLHDHRCTHRRFDTSTPLASEWWCVSYQSDSSASTMPVLSPKRDVHVRPVSNQRVWCVTVPPHHLILVRRVFRDGRGVVTKASRPLIVGNCLDDNLTLANLSFLMSTIYNKYGSAMSYLKRAVQANPMHVRSWYYLGQLYHYHLHDNQQARACYEKALSLAPALSHANTLKDYGNLLLHQFKNSTEAAEKYALALQVEPRHVKSLHLLAHVRVSQCDTLQDFDGITRLLRDAACSPMGVIETRFHAQEKYLRFLICQAEVYAEEHAHAHQQATTNGPSATNVSYLVEATKRWREAIDFMQCPHTHYTNREEGVAHAAAANMADSSSRAAGSATDPHGLPHSALHSSHAPATTHMQFLVSSSVIKPSVVTPVASANAKSSLTRAASDVGRKSTGSGSAADAHLGVTDTHTDLAPAAGFSWCVCPVCCAVNFDALPLADTLLSYAQFIHHHSSAPAAGPSGAAAPTSHVAAKIVEAEKWFQWAILVHHTLVTCRKKHKQLQVHHDMHHDVASAGAADDATAHETPLHRPHQPNTLSKSGARTFTGSTSNAHEVLDSEGPLNQSTYAFVPPAVKTAYRLTALTPTLASAQSALPAATPILLSVASASNASLGLETTAPFLTPTWLADLGVSASFHVIVSKPNPVHPLPTPSNFYGEAERRLYHMKMNGPPTLTRPMSSWDTSNPKKWQNLPAVIPSATSGSSGSGTTAKSPLSRHSSTSVSVLAQTEKELVGAELALEVDLEFDGAIERACECRVDHSFGEAATSCSCTFPSPRYLVSYAHFLMRVGRPSQAAYAFQSALVLHPFGRTGSTCLARMADCAIRAGVLTPGPHYATNVVLIYGLFRKSVGMDPWEGARMDAGDSIADRHILIASSTATALFMAFLKEHWNAIGPVPSSSGAPVPDASSTTTTGTLDASTTAAAGATAASTSLGATVPPPSIGPLLRGADAAQHQLRRMMDHFQSESATASATYRATNSGREKSAPTFALAIGNTNCKCRRPLRGKPCLCTNQLIRTMITKAQTIRTRAESKRKALAGEIRHHDAVTMQTQRARNARSSSGINATSNTTPLIHGSGDRERTYSEKSGRGGRGGGRGGATLSERKPRETVEKTTTGSTDESLSLPATVAPAATGVVALPPTREGSGAWAQMVVKSEHAAVVATSSSSLPKRTPSLARENSKESTSSYDAGIHMAGAKEKEKSMVVTSSGGSTPATATPIHASPMLPPAASPALLVPPIASMSVFPPTVPSTSLTPPTPIVVPILPTSQWKAPPTLVGAAASNAAGSANAGAASSTTLLAPTTAQAERHSAPLVPPTPFSLLPPAIAAPHAVSLFTPPPFPAPPAQFAASTTPLAASVSSFTFFSPPPTSAAAGSAMPAGPPMAFKQSSLRWDAARPAPQ